MNDPLLVSIIIPAYNAEDTLPVVLTAAKASDYPALEIIVIDDGSTDGTAETARQFDVIVYSKPNGGTGSARNFGARKANGAFYYFLDADVMIGKENISKFVETIRQYDVQYVMGCYSLEPLNDELVAHYKALSDYYMMPPDMRRGVVVGGLNGGGGEFYVADAFDAVGGFDEKILGASVEREEHWIRFFAKGYRSAVNPEIIARHKFPGFRQLTRNLSERVDAFLRIMGDDARQFGPYKSVRKGMLVPVSGFLATIALPGTVFIGWPALLPLAFFLALSSDIILLALRYKPLSMTVQLISLHLYFMALIFVAALRTKLLMGIAFVRRIFVI